MEQSPQDKRAEGRILRKRVQAAKVLESQPQASGDEESKDEGSDDDDDFESSSNSDKKEKVKQKKKKKPHTKQRKGGSSEDSGSEDYGSNGRKKLKQRKESAAAKEMADDEEDKRARRASKKAKQKRKQSQSSSDDEKGRSNPKQYQKHSKKGRAAKEVIGGSSDDDESEVSADTTPEKPERQKKKRRYSAAELKAKRFSGNAEDHQHASDVAILEIWMRTAIHDFSPNETYKHTVMFWSQKDPNSALRLLLKRHKRDITEMVARYGGEMRMLQIHGIHIRSLANNERAIQTKQIKLTWMSKQNPESRLVENMIEGELDANSDNPPRLYRTMQHLESVEALRQLVISPNMYKDKKLFDAFCTGIESGNFRQAKKRPFVPLHELITKAHEAHFRVELYFAMSRKVYKHTNTPSLYKERVKMFNHVIQSVREGREKWLEAAIEERKTSMTNEQRDEFDLVQNQGNNSEDDVDLSETDM